MKPLYRRNKFNLWTAGVLLSVIGLAGAAHACRSSLAQFMYLNAKYGTRVRDVRGIVRRCRSAHRLYPYNYYFCAFTAERLYRERSGADGSVLADRIELARFWCEEGLDLNPYKRKLRSLKARLLAIESPERAARYWDEFVQWDFWRPSNHAILVDLYVQAGKLAEAARSLKWLEGTKYHDPAAEQIDSAWEKERTLPFQVSE
ncbi:MAG: hypothetical protein R6V03_07705 [Kiritimatiellia bacterium]